MAFTVVLFSSAILVAYPLIVSSAASCASTTDTVHSVTYTITVQGADGSCPSTYADSSHLVHYVLSTSPSQNPYTVSISTNSCAGCPPLKVYANGWAQGTTFCGSPAPACADSGPWSGTINAGVQNGKTCDTAPVFVQFSSNVHPSKMNMLILEAGTGGVCGQVTTTTSTTTHSTTSTTTHSSTTTKTTSSTTTTSHTTTSKTTSTTSLPG